MNYLFVGDHIRRFFSFYLEVPDEFVCVFLPVELYLPTLGRQFFGGPVPEKFDILLDLELWEEHGTFALDCREIWLVCVLLGHSSEINCSLFKGNFVEHAEEFDLPSFGLHESVCSSSPVLCDSHIRNVDDAYILAFNISSHEQSLFSELDTV